jgi:hypothetical protein
VTPLLSGYRFRIPRRNGKDRRLFSEVSMVMMEGSKTNRAETLRMMLLGSMKERAQDSAGQGSTPLTQVAYREGFGWRFG